MCMLPQAFYEKSKTKKTKALCEASPLLYNFKVLNPDAEYVSFVTKLCRAAGDFGFLSPVDIDVIALTSQLAGLDIKDYSKFLGGKFTLQAPSSKKKSESLDGLEVKRAETKVEEFEENENSENDESQWISDANYDSLIQKFRQVILETDDDSPMEQSSGLTDRNFDSLSQINRTGVLKRENHQLVDRTNTQVPEEPDYSSEPRKTRTSLEEVTSKNNNSRTVACLTTDYTIQNVLIRIGLKVIAFNGLRIKSVKSWGLLCVACNKFTMDSEKLFCPSCGNHTLTRVEVITNSDKGISVRLLKSHYNLRGKVYSIPKPRGGRKGDLILCEDQIFIGGRNRLQKHEKKLVEKRRIMMDPLKNEGEPLESWWKRDKSFPTYSTNSIHVGLGPGNPNSNRWQKKRNTKHKAGIHG